MTPDQVTLAVIARAPVPGRAKTRLSPPCSPEQAASIAEAALRDTLDAVVCARVGRRVVVLDGERPEWIPPEIDVVAQRGGGLDERLGAAFVDLGGPTVVIAMDTPQVTAELLSEVAELLCAPGTDAVLGPASDGGYWVIGLRSPDPAVFSGVPMSVAHTHCAQLARLAQLGLSTAAAPQLTDVDTFDQAVEVARVASGPRFRRGVDAVVSVLAPTAGQHPDNWA